MFVPELDPKVAAVIILATYEDTAHNLDVAVRLEEIFEGAFLLLLGHLCNQEANAINFVAGAQITELDDFLLTGEVVEHHLLETGQFHLVFFED